MRGEYTLKKNIKISVIVFILGAILAQVFCAILEYDFKNVMFLGGLTLLSISIFSSLSGGNVNISGNTLGELNAECFGSRTLKLSRLSCKEEKGIEFTKDSIENIFNNYILVVPAILFILLGTM